MMSNTDLSARNMTFGIGDWYKGKTCELAYNGKGLLEKVTMMADGSTLETERLTYNAQGKITSLTLSVPGNNDVTEVYTYDGHGDIIKAGREDFVFEYEYDQDKLAEKTFIPRHTVRDLTYFGEAQLRRLCRPAGERQFYARRGKHKTTGTGR